MVNNGSTKYDHDLDGTLTQMAGCEAKFRNVDYETYLSVRYQDDVLTVSTNIENRNEWKPCLQVNGVRLPTGYYFGASAETGDLSDNHDIQSFKFYEITSTNVSVFVLGGSIVLSIVDCLVEFGARKTLQLNFIECLLAFGDNAL